MITLNSSAFYNCYYRGHIAGGSSFLLVEACLQKPQLWTRLLCPKQRISRRVVENISKYSCRKTSTKVCLERICRGCWWNPSMSFWLVLTTAAQNGRTSFLYCNNVQRSTAKQERRWQSTLMLSRSHFSVCYLVLGRPGTRWFFKRPLANVEHLKLSFYCYH